MKFAFDSEKDARNRAAHGVSLMVGRTVIENRVGERLAPDLYGEPRHIAYGLLEGRLFVCVYTVREDVVRIVSVRPASRQERKRWWK